MTLFLSLTFVACADNLGMQSEESVDGEGGGMTLQVPMSFSMLVARTRALDFQTNSEQVHVQNVWVGIYSTNGVRVGSSKMILNEDYTVQHNSTVFNVPVNEGIFYNTANAKVYIVGVANYGGIKDKDGIDLIAQLDAAHTWEEFINVSVDAASAEASDYPLMSGMFSTSHKNNTVDSEGTPSYLNGTDYVTVTLKNEKKTVTIETEGAIHLRRLYSQIIVNVNAGEGVELSNLSWQVCNMPTAVYLQERATEKADDIEDEEDWQKLTPNVADKVEVGYVNSDEFFAATKFDHTNKVYDTHGEKLVVETDKGYTFNFWHYENKHWGLTGCNEYNDREKTKEVNGEVIYTALCPGETTFNNKASYFIIKADVTDAKKGIKGKVQYLIHEGYVNDEAGDRSENNAKDFSCFRNTTYTYNININGLNSVAVNVVSEDGAAKFPGVTGDVSGAMETTIGNGGGTVTDKIVLSDKLRSELKWRIYYKNEGTDFGSDWNGQEDVFGTMWMLSDQYVAAVNENDELYKGVKIIGEGNEEMTLQEFMSPDSDDETLKSYTIQFPAYTSTFVGNPEEAPRYLFLCVETGYSSNGSTWNQPLFVYKQLPPDNRKFLPAPTWVGDNTLNVVYGLEECVVKWNAVSDAASYTLYVGDNEEKILATEDLSYTIPYNQLTIGKNTVKLVANPQADDNTFFPSTPATLTVNLNRSAAWDFKSTGWQNFLKKIETPSGDLTKQFEESYEHLTIGNDGKSTFTYGMNYIQTGGTGSTTKRYFKFTVPANTISDGKVVIKCAASSANYQSDRFIHVNVGGAVQDQIGGFSYNTPEDVTFSIHSKLDAATDVYIYSTGSLRIYSIQFIPD